MAKYVVTLVNDGGEALDVVLESNYTDVHDITMAAKDYLTVVNIEIKDN